MKAAEERAFAGGATAESLMDAVGEQMALAVRQFFPTPGTCLAFFGKGHNGGDALAAARRLGEAGWKVHLIGAYREAEWAPLTRKKFDEAGLCDHSFPRALAPAPGRPIVVLDGLLGIGARGPMREPILHFARTIRSLRHAVNAFVFALDIPTGLDGDTGAPAPNAIEADFTLTVAMPKVGLVADEAINYVGRLVVLPIPELSAVCEPNAEHCVVSGAEAVAPLLPRRPFDSHKGMYGRIGIIAGSRGFTGAAVISSAAAVRAGGGLVTLYATPDIQAVLAGAVVPEVMVHKVNDYREVLDARHDVIALGPGLGKSHGDELMEMIRRATCPMVVDADGLNVLSTELRALDEAAGPRLLTPHPGEMARLDPGSRERSRLETVRRFTREHPCVLLLKGARTLVGAANRPPSYNNTGNPGMASGGMGDALTGVCAALAGRGLELYDAATIGAWVCGRAAEIALSGGEESEESLSVTKMIERLGPAFNDLRARCF